MEKISLFNYIFLFSIILSLFHFSSNQTIIPESFKNDDMLFPSNDIINNYYYSLIDAKVLTKEEITLHLKKQGIHLTRDNCCQDSTDINVWNGIMEQVSDFKEIYSNAKYYPNKKQIEYDFPVDKIENVGYTLFHKVRVINKDNTTTNLNVIIKYKDLTQKQIFSGTVPPNYLFQLEITCENQEMNSIIKTINWLKIGTNNIKLEGEISSIIFEYPDPDLTYSPTIALHWTYLKMRATLSNFSFKGNSLCDNINNPCVNGYYCQGGVCKQCHPSCYDCVNGGLSTDCYSRCNTHSVSLSPERGSCSIGYVDLNQFEDFKIENIVPPPRNNRMTISLWMYVSAFPDEETYAFLNNSFSDNINIEFKFSTNKLNIRCTNVDIDITNVYLNTWFFIKCAIKYDHDTFQDKNSLYIKAFNPGTGSSFYSEKQDNTQSAPYQKCNHEFKKYFEPDDFISLNFLNFGGLKKTNEICHVYIKQLVLFREFLPEPYDNKYFNMEKLISGSTIELPEILFIIPFDELKKQNNLYKIRTYSYQGNVEVNDIILSPKESGTSFTLYPPKLFKRLDLLNKNKEYTSPDLINTQDINIPTDSKILIAARTGVPLTCEDYYFLNYNYGININDPSTYSGTCVENCDSNTTTILFGLGDTKGFCNRKCDGNTNCVYKGEDLINLQEKYSCKNGFYNMFYYCETEAKKDSSKNIFYYDPNYSPGNIVLDLRLHNLKSYIIEFWYFTENCGKITSGYIFYTDQIQLKKVETSYNVYTTAHDIRGAFTIHEGYWNQIVLEVYYDPRADRNKKTKVYIQTNYNSGYADLVDESENDYKLNYIYFCNGRRASCNNLDLNWYCGYYKNLRLFNGNMAQRHVTFRYDDFYPEFLVSSILLYLPLYSEYIANNILTQYINSAGQGFLSPFTTKYLSNNWIFPQYNFCNKPDTSSGDCLKPFDNNNNCFYCDNNNNLYLERIDGGKEVKCTTNVKYVVKLPPAPLEITLPDAPRYTGRTVTFFIKLYGFKENGEMDIIILSDNLKISYNSYPDHEYFGLNLKSYIGSSEKFISNYYDFRKHFGLWTFISVSTFNQQYKSYFPPMVRFEINQKKMPIIGSLDYLTINKIKFSDKIYALIRNVKVYDTYFIGAHTFETHGDVSSINNALNNYIKFLYEPKDKKNDCENQEGNNLICEAEKDDDLLQFNSPTELDKYNCFINETHLEKKHSCSEDCDICFGDSEYDCSCNYANNIEKIFLGNVSNHFCKKLTYINFAGAEEITVNNLVSPGEQFSLHFWFFAHSYIENVFKGFIFDWENQLKIKLELDSTNKYNYVCEVQTETTNAIEIKMDTWNFLHCAVDYGEKIIYYTTEEDSFSVEMGLTSHLSGTKLKIKDLTVDNEIRDWGILFYKHIRIWNYAYPSSSFLSRINIINNYFDTELINQWNTVFNKDHIAEETRPTSYDINVLYESDKLLGTNIIPEDIYKEMQVKPILCTENGEYYNRKTSTCDNFIGLSDIVDDEIVIPGIDVAYSHNYGIAFWILMEDYADIQKSIDIIWEYHMQISLQYHEYDSNNIVFKSYCFPQNYKPYTETLEKDNNDLSLDEKAETILNSAVNEYKNDLSGNWEWIQCSLSYTTRSFYLNEQEETLKSETLYVYDNNEVKNDEPLGFFFNELEKGSLSKLTIKINKNNKEVYLRCLYLFKDHLPYNYNFKYMNMYQIDKEEFPPLTLALNFGEFEKDGQKVSFKYKKFTSLENLMTPSSVDVHFNGDPLKALSTNFVFLPLCNPLEKEKYNPTKNLCQEIENCDETKLNCLYCMGEDMPLVCKTNYYINIDDDSGTVECLNYCKGNLFRSPGTLPTQGICGTGCTSDDTSEFLLTCPNTAASILSYQSDYECKTGYNRIGYQCFEIPTEENGNYGALFYSGVNHPYNIYQSFTNDFISLIGNGYVLEFWFMIDNVIFNQDKYFDEPSKRFYYFYSNVHELFVQKDSNGDLKYTYLFNRGILPSYKIDLEDRTHIHRYEWNKIIIFADSTISGIKKVGLYVNFNKDLEKEKEILVEPEHDLTLVYIAFCSTKPDLNFPACVIEGTEIHWASAFYNNLRVWNIYTSNIDTIQSYINGIYKEYPQSLILFYPLTIEYLDNNRMTNIMSNLEEHIMFKCESVAKCGVYNKDNIIIYNYSSKFDWGLKHKEYFVDSMGGTDKNEIIKGQCAEHCLRCFESNDITECYECEEGYVLQFKECKNAKNFYFLKTPSGGIASPINFVLQNDDGSSITILKGFTLTFWMKFYGVPYSTITEYCTILSLDSNTYMAFQRSTNHLVILENSKKVFDDNNFGKYFGKWIPISIADYISNEQNDIYPNMFTLSVNRIDIPFCEGYSLPSTGIKINQIQLGFEIIALFAQLRIYSKFIQGGYGHIRSQDYTNNLFYSKSLIGTSRSNCIDPSTDLISNVNILCAPDYSYHFLEDEYCNQNDKFYLPYNNENELDLDNKCQDCDGLCNTLCFGSSDEQCTCDMTDGIFWLRRNVNMETYCEHIPYLDFGNINEYKYEDAPMSETKEYTIEFWLFVYSYNQVTMNFKNMYIEWNFHNRLRLYNEQNSLKVNCQPIWKDYDFITTNYPDVKQGSLKYYQWNYIRCGTDYKNKRYFLNTIIEYDLKAKPEFYIDIPKENREQPSEKKYFKIYRGDDFLVNFGFVFLREIKLWRQYNLDFLDSQYIYFDLTKTTISQIKEDFPGLLLYYQNDFHLSDRNNPIITELLTDKSKELGRDPGYIGYNIVDPNRMTYYKNLTICPYGQVYKELTNECLCPEGLEKDANDDICVPISGNEEEYSLCKIYSNLEKQCFQCKYENVYLNKWIEEFDEKCYYDCPVTLFEDSLINQCRRCHETCYECTNENYNDCTSCTGELYFNFKENTCIPNCETAGLTKSLSRPNICVIFDADASLVNVDSLTPIDVNNFNYIEAKVINPTSPDYKTLWLFDVEKTNQINRELGFDDDLPSNASPFTGDKTKVKVDLDTNFFQIRHQYVFGMKIYTINEGVEVPIYIWWTLTMNAPPFGGKLTVMPYLGLYNTTTFIMRCIDFLDENTPAEDIEFYFYYVEMNTNSKIKLCDGFSLNNEVYSNFTVRYYQFEYSNITIYCQARDKFGAISETSNVITIVNNKKSPLYNLKQIIASFYIVDDALTDIQLLARAEVLMSLGINPYNTHVPEKFFTTYESSLTGEVVEMTDPLCVAGYCNDNGECQVIDVALTCHCLGGYLGKECFLDKDGYTDLSYYYKKLYQRLINRLNQVGPGINDMIFQAFYKLYFAAQKFFQEESFFETNMAEFKSYLYTSPGKEYITLNEDRVNKLFDLNEFFFNFYYIKENKLKLENKINENYPFRNRTLTVSEYSVYQVGFQKFFNMLDEDTVFLIKEYKEEYIYESEHFSYYLIRINEFFDDINFFESLKTVWITYKPVVLFMNCLRAKYSSFDYYFNYIEYAVNPLSFESQFYPNITSPLISIKIYDLNGHPVPIRNCPSNNLIKINLPFNSYDWINYINKQKWLFLPENYKIESDPVFRDPILIWENGSVSDDTVEQRILKYYRYYNIVGLVYTPSELSFYEYTSFLFKNISDTFLLMFETNHLSSFTAMLIPNIMNFIVDGRFYYFPRYEVLLCLENYIYNPAFYIWGSLLFLFIGISIFFAFYDYQYFDNLEILDFLKKEIVKVHFPYGQLKFGLNDENIYKLIPKESKLKKGSNRQYRQMFKEYDLGDIKENDNESKNDNDFSENENNKKSEYNLSKKITEAENIYTSTRNRFATGTGEKEEKDGKEKAQDEVTEIRTHRKVKIKNKNKNKSNPPRKSRMKLSSENENKLSEIYLKQKKSSKDNQIPQELNDFEEDQKDEKGYGEGNLDEDFNENKIEDNLDSENNNISSKQSKRMSKYSTSSRSSKKRYYYGKYGTKANLISLQRFHNKAGRTNVDNDGIPLDIINEEEERGKALIAFSRLSVSTCVFFSYNLKVRHILIAPFINLTLFNNRWKKLMVLLTQFYIQQLVISVALTMGEDIIMSNILGILVVSILASVISDVVVYLFVFLFQSSNYQRKRLYRLVMMGENFTVMKAWTKLKRQMNFKLFFGFIIALGIWGLNFYITLIYTSVWKYQRTTWITCFFLSLIMDLVVGELLTEGLCAFCYSKRVKSVNFNILGEGLNRLRAYRTMWP